MSFFEALQILLLVFVTPFYFIAGVRLFKTRFLENILKWVKITFYLLLILTILSIVTSPTLEYAVQIITSTSLCLVFSLYFFWSPMGNVHVYYDHLWEKARNLGLQCG